MNKIMSILSKTPTTRPRKVEVFHDLKLQGDNKREKTAIKYRNRPDDYKKVVSKRDNRVPDRNSVKLDKSIYLVTILTGSRNSRR